MRTLILIFLGTLVASESRADTRFMLTNGVIHYTDEDGREGHIQVGSKCADLWVSPIADSIAFIAIEKETPARNLLGTDTEMLVQKSSIYIARKSDHFAPHLIVARIFQIDGRPWQIVRYPQISPDGDKVFFEVPFTVTTSRLMMFSVSSGAYAPIEDVTDYCVVWNGKYSRSLLVQRRRLSERRDEGILYQCYLRAPSGVMNKIADECFMFSTFASSWSRRNGGVCKLSE